MRSDDLEARLESNGRVTNEIASDELGSSVEPSFDDVDVGLRKPVVKIGISDARNTVTHYGS